ncbi:methyltransferase type 11 [Gluconacetobacter liquefaciens]|uniref:Methyltransferase domain-containing protein n=1 Tax=Gluconacetobacter liquefaciens TaxID=89584 RepID=A0A370GAZ0_GLULI|nr:methyltransferase domain-containing protein [Gluconacetobacter liquefaciens]MBB2185852.1 methyltransferase domain-containing protein [Gluconacetobacter liquefaciens]RDI39664.1 methyltransferase family protein [Gluconacetobacter liquefaciens]GBR03682.1 SAM-dependent methyltransferase [Gluconacetobacter liquefaciens NRIC 0522]GEB36302.1 methyltransferase type 11 [Gluconacetobacter liquefaciens]
MQDDICTAARFYASGAGENTARLLRHRMQAFWPRTGSDRILGLGYTQPFLPLWTRPDGPPCISARLNTPVTREAPAFTPEGIRDCVVTADRLPFPDLSFDRVLMVHALEVTQRPDALIRSVWKVMKDHGRLLLVVPNRAGWWAHSDDTPFGQGEPFSTRQIARRLSQAFLCAERHDGALFMPPLGAGHRRAAALAENAGHMLLPQLGGVFVIEAVKDVWSGVPAVTAPALIRAPRRIYEPG